MGLSVRRSFGVYFLVRVTFLFVFFFGFLDVVVFPVCWGVSLRRGSGSVTGLGASAALLLQLLQFCRRLVGCCCLVSVQTLAGLLLCFCSCLLVRFGLSLGGLQLFVVLADWFVSWVFVPRQRCGVGVVRVVGIVCVVVSFRVALVLFISSFVQLGGNIGAVS